MPPDECIETALWDRFHWSWRDTDGLPQARLRRIFVVIEQQRATKDAVERLGSPDENRVKAEMLRRIAQQDTKDQGNEIGEE